MAPSPSSLRSATSPKRRGKGVDENPSVTFGDSYPKRGAKGFI